MPIENMARQDATQVMPGVNTYGAYRLMTAEIVFAENDIGDAAVTWQDYDVMPGFPRLRAFIEHWRDNPAMKVQSVTVTEIAETELPACKFSPSTAALH